MHEVTIEPFGEADSAHAAALHAVCFPVDPWPEKAFVGLLANGAEGCIATRQGVATGLILVRAAGDEAEILTFAVAPALRRQGLGRALLNSSIASLTKKGVSRLFLEVAKDNSAGLGLYNTMGFVSVGDRSGYYAGKNGSIDAHVMMKSLDRMDKVY